MVSQELTHVRETIQKIMQIWQKNKKKNFIVKIPFFYDYKEFKILLKQMLSHYQVPVSTNIEQIPSEFMCECGHTWKAKTHNNSQLTCPKCEKNDIKIISREKIQVF